MKNDAMVKYKEGFFAKLKRKFKNLFNRNDEVKNNNLNNVELINNEEETSSKNSDKDKFFELYRTVLNKEIDLDSLQPNDLVKIHKMLKEEVRMKKEILSQKIKVLEEKKEIIKKIIDE